MSKEETPSKSPSPNILRWERPDKKQKDLHTCSERDEGEQVAAAIHIYGLSRNSTFSYSNKLQNLQWLNRINIYSHTLKFQMDIPNLPIVLQSVSQEFGLFAPCISIIFKS